jgi:nucleotide-binding universal stress UspA family protein
MRIPIKLTDVEDIMKILFATDGSEYSMNAVKSLARSIRTQDADVLVLTIVEPIGIPTPPQMAPGWAPDLAELHKEEYKEANNCIARSAEPLREAGFKVQTRVVEAEIRSGILDVAAEWKADMIVLGARGSTGIKRLLLGSVAEAVARHAHCSALVVRPSAND